MSAPGGAEREELEEIEAKAECCFMATIMPNVELFYQGKKHCGESLNP